MAEKRRTSGRAAKGAPASKKARTTGPRQSSTPAKAATPKEQTPVAEVVQEERQVTPLPNRIFESKPLPTLSEAQPLDLQDDEYQSISSSGVLLASFDRSRQKWVSGAFLERYWTKTSTRKDAPPPPPNNPQKSWMKEIGPCSITVEPLTFAATAFFVKEPGVNPPVAYVQQQQQQQPAPQAKPPLQYAHTPQQSPAQSPYGTPYRPQTISTPAQANPYYQSRTLPPVNNQPASSPMPTQNTPDNRLPPIMPANGRPPAPHPPAAPSTPAPPPPSAKPSPDPVIQMLATRASTDHELKSLMKVVATGNANQEQLRIFQRHIDELTAKINLKKVESPAAKPLQPTPTGASTPSAGYQSGASTPKPLAPSAHPQIQPHPSHAATPPPPRPNQYPNQYQQPHPPQHQHRHPVIPSYPIALEFQGPNASPDRFLFPAYSILEFLSPYSLFASFLVIRKGDTPPTDKGEDPETAVDIYEPVTIKVSVPEGRSPSKDVLEYIRRSVKPPDEVRAWMSEKIDKCARAERRYLAIRLPHKSGIIETAEDIAEKEQTPIVQEKKPRPPKKKREGTPKDNAEPGKEADKVEGPKQGDDKDKNEPAEQAKQDQGSSFRHPHRRRKELPL